jgi:hypothetical protein
MLLSGNQARATRKAASRTHPEGIKSLRLPSASELRAQHARSREIDAKRIRVIGVTGR